MPYCKISDRDQISTTIIAAMYFALGGRESLKAAVITSVISGFGFSQVRIRIFDIDQFMRKSI